MVRCEKDQLKQQFKENETIKRRAGREEGGEDTIVSVVQSNPV